MIFPRVTDSLSSNVFASFSGSFSKNAFALFAATAVTACGGGGGGGGGVPPGSDPSITYVKGSFVDFTTDANGNQVGLGCLEPGDTLLLGCDQFGDAVALSDDGTVMVVGAPFEDSNGLGNEQDAIADNSILDSGAAYVFARNNGEWSQQQYLKASNPGDKDFFGASVALSGDGNTLVVAAYGEDSGADGVDGDQADDSQPSSGAVYIFARSVGSNSWTQQAFIKASDSAADHEFGFALALNEDGSRLAVGAPGAEAVYTFDFDGSVWSQQTKLQASNGDANDRFGSAVGLNADGAVLTVGAWGEDGDGIDSDQADNSVNDAGAVYVFARELDGSWLAPEYLKASDIAAGNWFGRSLAIDDTGERLVIGAPGENQDQGRAYVFERVTSRQWQQSGILEASNADPGDAFGSAVALAALTGDLIYIGARGEDSKAKNRNGDQFDDEVDPDPAMPYNNFDSGAVYEYRLEAGSWQRGDYIKATNAGGGDKFGSTVASSQDGLVFAVGAPLEDGPSTGVNGPQVNAPETQAGAVYIFE